MNTSDKLDALAIDLALAQGEMKNASFDKDNPFFKSKYATLAQVRDTVTPALTKHGLCIIQATSADDSRIVLSTRLLHKSGQWIESTYPVAIGKPQEMGSAITYARRYCLSAICGIASEEDDDGNEAQKSPPIAPTIPKAFTPATGPTKHGTLEDKDELCREIDGFMRLKDLEIWGGNYMTKDRINSLHPDHADTVRNSYVEKMRELKATLAA